MLILFCYIFGVLILKCFVVSHSSNYYCCYRKRSCICTLLELTMFLTGFLSELLCPQEHTAAQQRMAWGKDLLHQP